MKDTEDQPTKPRRRRRRPHIRATKEQLREMIQNNVPGGYDLFEEMTGICAGTARALVAAKAVPHIRLGRRLVRFQPADIQKWFEARKVVPIRKSAKLAPR